MSSSSGAVVVCILLTMQTFCTEAMDPYIHQRSGSTFMQSSPWPQPFYPQNPPNVYSNYDVYNGANPQSIRAMTPHFQQGSGSNDPYLQNPPNFYSTNENPYTGAPPQTMTAMNPHFQQGSGSNDAYLQNPPNFYSTNENPYTGAPPQTMTAMNMNNRQGSGLPPMDSNEWYQNPRTANQQQPNKQFFTNQQNPYQPYQMTHTNSYYASPQSRPTVSTRSEEEPWNFPPKGAADQLSLQMNGYGNDMTGMMSGNGLQTIRKQVGALLLNFLTTFDPNQCERLQILIAGMRPSTREKITNILTIVKSLLEDSLGGATPFNIAAGPASTGDIPQSFVPNVNQVAASYGNQEPLPFRDDPANAVNVPEPLPPFDKQPQPLVPDGTQATVSSDKQQSLRNNPTILNEDEAYDDAKDLEKLANDVLNKQESQATFPTAAPVTARAPVMLRPQVNKQKKITNN